MNIQYTKGQDNMIKKQYNSTDCSKINGIKPTDKFTQISIETPFPNSLLTLIIFANNYNKFPQPIAEYYKIKIFVLKVKLNYIKVNLR